jgi:hypothetical protein
MRRPRRALSWALAIGALSAVALTAGAQGSTTVHIPDVTGRPVALAYLSLHHLGLRVSLPASSFVCCDPDATDGVVTVSPRPGKRVAPGSVVKLTIGCPRCGAGSPGVPVHLRNHRVPRFVGHPASEVTQWLRGKTIDLSAHLGPLHAGDAPRLFDNYRVTRQRPHAGTRLAFGVGHKCCGGTGGSFRITPLTIWAKQVRG